MSRNYRFSFYLIALAILVTAAVCFAAGYPVSSTRTGDELVVSHKFRSGSLDDDYTQLRYIKTTDFGATWSGVVQAGDISGISQATLGNWDLSAVVLANNELSYAVALPTATPPGLYSMTGPAFTPVLAVAQGDNDFYGADGGGWADVGTNPNGDLFIVYWGRNASDVQTVWGVKSTNSGATWGTPAVLATSPAIRDSCYPHVADMNSNTDWYIVWQKLADQGQEQFICRVSNSTMTPTITSTGAYGPASGNQPSYYIACTKPIAYDPTANALYVVYRNSDASGVGISYSSNGGSTFSNSALAFFQRYPSVTLRVADATPFVFSNVGAGNLTSDDLHWAWWAKDDGGYNGGLWTDPDTVNTILSHEGSDLLYINQGYFWDANRGVSMQNYWGAHTPDGAYSSRTTNGGTNWIDRGLRWEGVAAQLDVATVPNNELVGGSAGVAYIVFAGKTGVTDDESPVYSGLELLSQPNLGPYSLRCHISDNIKVDTTDNWLVWYCPTIADGAMDSVKSSAVTFDNETTLAGWYSFTLPATNHNGGAWVQGDSIFIYCDGRDLSGNYGVTDWEQIILAGNQWLSARDNDGIVPAKFMLYGNYPNPFNPTTQISFNLATASNVTLTVFNTLGQEVARLADHTALNAGRHSLAFDGTNIASGVYLYKITAGNFTATRKMVLMK